MRDDGQRLLYILEAVANLEKYTTRGYEEFNSNELIRIWIAYHLQVIGEAAANLSREFREAHLGVPWSRIVGMRNILVHQYFGIDWREIWKTANIDIPSLKREVQLILDQIEETLP
jgi:uncharacterized protein with HEPN domain